MTRAVQGPARDSARVGPPAQDSAHRQRAALTCTGKPSTGQQPWLQQQLGVHKALTAGATTGPPRSQRRLSGSGSRQGPLTHLWAPAQGQELIVLAGWENALLLTGASEGREEVTQALSSWPHPRGVAEHHMSPRVCGCSSALHTRAGSAQQAGAGPWGHS